MFSIEDGMSAAWAARCGDYQPVFRGETLVAERQDPEASLANLLWLLGAGLHPVRFRANPDRAILVEFAEGGSYLATGFSFGEEGAATQAFAAYVDQAFGEASLSNYDHLVALDVDETLADGGDIEFDVMP